MAFRLYRQFKDAKFIDDPAIVHHIVKYNVLPTLAANTVVFCASMFFSPFFPRLDSGPYLWPLWTAIAVYFTVWISICSLANKKKHQEIALGLSFLGSFMTGYVQQPLVRYAMVALGDIVDVGRVFSIAVLSATLLLVAMAIVNAHFPKMFYALNSTRIMHWVLLFLLLSSVTWLWDLALHDFNLYLIIEPVIVIIVFGFYAIYDMGKLQIYIAEGKWVYGTVELMLDFFILIIRFFALLTGSSSHSSSKR
nr:hypothetical protein [Candidatus Sigynarchaeota archaeon]